MMTTGHVLAALLIFPAFAAAAPKFMYPNSETPCILADFQMDFTLDYTEKGSPMLSQNYSLPDKGIVVTGSCVSKTTHIMTLTDIDALTLIFTVDAKNKVTDLQLTYKFNASVHFKEATYTEWITMSSPVISLYTDPAKDQSYLCYAHGPGGLINKDPDHKAVLYIFFYDVQLQGFSVNGPKFGTEVECPADPTAEPLTTTEPSPSTGSPPPTGPPVPIPPPSGNYSVSDNNKTCLYLEGQLWLSVQYLNSSGQNDTRLIGVENARSSGACGQDVDVLLLEFPVDFYLQLVIQKKVDGSTFSYELKNITVMYNITDGLFPNADASMMDTIFIADRHGLTIWSTPGDAFFVCYHQQTVALEGAFEVSLYTKNLKVAAFHEGKDTPNVTGSDYVQCEADMDTSSIVPIAVGAALAGLVVIVLIAYLVGRRRSQKGYETV